MSTSPAVRNPFVSVPAMDHQGKDYPVAEAIETGTAVANPPPPLESETAKFCERRCCNYFWGCCCSLAGLLVVAFVIGLVIPAIGLIIAAVAPSVMILVFVNQYYKEQVTAGQMTVSFLEAILWMIPLIVWDILWIISVQAHLKDGGLCATCVISYLLNSYFVAGFCEELLKWCVISRLKNSILTSDHRALMVYGVCAGAGFATVENILYVLSSDFGTAIVRGFTAVPLHCLTGCILGLSLAREKCLGIQTPFWKVIFIPWLLHGSYDFILTMGANSREFAPASPFLWLFVYSLGLIYARYIAVEFSNACPTPHNIHLAIVQGDPPILGTHRIAQCGQGTDCVCECFLLCACCCKSVARPSITL
mmetsp:Transcript_4357/g.4474  ORF Transcript_4357/g.4474 Transcript_4357/m.4474 type:complete len:364 (+) Transcript_4357:222-1313(+)